MKLEGQWEGYYEYGAGYTLPHFGQRVKMTAFIEGNSDSFTGTIEEEQSDFSVNYPSTIKGFCEEDFISFVKTYPVYPVLDVEGQTSLIKEEGNLEVHYEGFLDFENKALYGTWTIVELFSAENGEHFESVCEGIWMLRSTP